MFFLKDGFGSCPGNSPDLNTAKNQEVILKERAKNVLELFKGEYQFWQHLMWIIDNVFEEF